MSVTIKSTRDERTLSVRPLSVDDVHLTIEDPTRRNKVLVISVPREALIEALKEAAA